MTVFYFFCKLFVYSVSRTYDPYTSQKVIWLQKINRNVEMKFKENTVTTSMFFLKFFKLQSRHNIARKKGFFLSFCLENSLSFKKIYIIYLERTKSSSFFFPVIFQETPRCYLSFIESKKSCLLVVEHPHRKIQHFSRKLLWKIQMFWMYIFQYS